MSLSVMYIYIYIYTYVYICIYNMCIYVYTHIYYVIIVIPLILYMYYKPFIWYKLCFVFAWIAEPSPDRSEPRGPRSCPRCWPAREPSVFSAPLYYKYAHIYIYIYIYIYYVYIYIYTYIFIIIITNYTIMVIIIIMISSSSITITSLDDIRLVAHSTHRYTLESVVYVSVVSLRWLRVGLNMSSKWGPRRRLLLKAQLLDNPGLSKPLRETATICLSMRLNGAVCSGTGCLALLIARSL